MVFPPPRSPGSRDAGGNNNFNFGFSGGWREVAAQTGPGKLRGGDLWGLNKRRRARGELVNIAGGRRTLFSPRLKALRAVPDGLDSHSLWTQNTRFHYSMRRMYFRFRSTSMLVGEGLYAPPVSFARTPSPTLLQHGGSTIDVFPFPGSGFTPLPHHLHERLAPLCFNTAGAP